jgi:hypothetical protein
MMGLNRGYHEHSLALGLSNKTFLHISLYDRFAQGILLLSDIQKFTLSTLDNSTGLVFTRF